MRCGARFPSRRRAGSRITFLFTRRHCSLALIWLGFNRLADELEDEAILAAGKRPGS